MSKKSLGTDRKQYQKLFNKLKNLRINEGTTFLL